MQQALSGVSAVSGGGGGGGGGAISHVHNEDEHDSARLREATSGTKRRVHLQQRTQSASQLLCIDTEHEFMHGH